MGNKAESSKLLVILDLSGDLSHLEAIQEPNKSCLISTKDTPITQETPGDLVAVHHEPGSKSRCYNKRCSSCCYHLRNYKDISGALCQELEAETNIYVLSIISQERNERKGIVVACGEGTVIHKDVCLFL